MAMDWIDIKDKSKWPERDGTTVILGALLEDGYMDADIGSFDKDDGPVWSDCCSWRREQSDITHWMPIPQLKEKL